MTEFLASPDVESVVRSYLQTSLGATPKVVTNVPKTRPASFVRIIAAGGRGRRSLVLSDHNMIFEAWAASETAAATLAYRLEAYMLGANQVASSGIYHTSSFGSPVNLPDPDSGQHRYTFTLQVTTRSSAL